MKEKENIEQFRKVERGEIKIEIKIHWIDGVEKFSFHRIEEFVIEKKMKKKNEKPSSIPKNPSTFLSFSISQLSDSSLYN